MAAAPLPAGRAGAGGFLRATLGPLGKAGGPSVPRAASTVNIRTREAADSIVLLLRRAGPPVLARLRIRRRRPVPLAAAPLLESLRSKDAPGVSRQAIPPSPPHPPPTAAVTRRQVTNQKHHSGRHSPAPSHHSGRHSPAPSHHSGRHSVAPSHHSGRHSPAPSHHSGGHSAAPSHHSGGHSAAPSYPPAPAAGDFRVSAALLGARVSLFGARARARLSSARARSECLSLARARARVCLSLARARVRASLLRARARVRAWEGGEGTCRRRWSSRTRRASGYCDTGAGGGKA